MRARTVLLASTSLLAMTAHAYALEAIGSLVISAFLSVGAGSLLATGSAAVIGLTAIQTIGSLALTAANFIRAKPPSADPNTLKNTTKGAEGPGRYAFGRVMMEGKIAFGNTAKYDIHRLILHCFGPIDAVEEYFYDGRSVTVEDDGAVSSPPYVKPSGSNLYLRTKPGDGAETVWPQLKAAFPELVTDDFRAAGIGQTLLTFINPGTGSPRFPKLLTGGVKPVKILARVGHAFDPRTNQTKWTRNGVLWCAHWLARLPGWSSAMIDWTDIAVRANEADALVPVVGGTAPRCTLSGGWEGPLTTDIVLEMLDSAGLEVREMAPGKYSLAWLEDDPATELVMPWSQAEEGIASPYIDHDLSGGPEGAKRPNICTLEYFSPERMYEVAEADTSEIAWAKVEHDQNIYGDQELRVRLPFCDSVPQASRIARRMFYERRAESGLVKTTMAGLATWGKRVVTIEVPDLGNDNEPLSLKCRKGPVRTDQADGTCEIPVTVVPAELQIPWAPATMEAKPPPVLPTFEPESDIPTPVAPVEYAQVEYPDTTREIRLRFTMPTYPAPEPGETPPGPINVAEASRRSYAGALPNAWASMTEYRAGSTTTWHAWAEADWQGLDADFRARFFNTDEEGSNWSPYLETRPVAAPNNTPTAAPALALRMVRTPLPGEVTQYTLYADITPSELRAAQVSANGTFANCRPDQVTSIVVYDDSQAPEGGIDVTARSYTSNGTPGAAVMDTYTHS